MSDEQVAHTAHFPPVYFLSFVILCVPSILRAFTAKEVGHFLTTKCPTDGPEGCIHIGKTPVAPTAFHSNSILLFFSGSIARIYAHTT